MLQPAIMLVGWFELGGFGCAHGASRTSHRIRPGKVLVPYGAAHGLAYANAIGISTLLIKKGFL